MATFDDLLTDAQPALVKYAIGEMTEGRDWSAKFELVDATDSPIDLQALGVTGECVIYDKRPNGSVVLSPSVTITGSNITISATKAATAGKAAGKSQRDCPWRFTLTETATGRSCDVWGVRDSGISIRGDD